MDGTLVPYTTDHPILKIEDRHLRPHAREVIEFLEGIGVENHIWSRAGQGNALEVVHRLGLPDERAHAKPEFSTPEDLRNIPAPPDLVIDDNVEESILVYPHILVSTYEGDDRDTALLDILPDIRAHFEALSHETLQEFRVRWRRKRRIPLRVKIKRRRYYRRHRGAIRRAKRRWRRRPRTKRLMRLRKRLVKRFGKRLRRMRMRVSL